MCLCIILASRRKAKAALHAHFGAVLVLAVVGVADDGLLLLHPRLGLARVRQVLLRLQRVVEQLLARARLRLERLPLGAQLAQPAADLLRAELAARQDLVACTNGVPMCTCSALY